MAELMFYNNPVPLSKEKHKKLRFKKSETYEFASGVNTVPLSGPEFFACSRNHPIMFVETEKSGFLPVALLSLTPKSNDLDKKWSDVYVPSFIKRYPFALAEKRDIVMIDESAPHFSYDEGEFLFDDKGEPTSVLHGMLQYLNQLDQAHQLTLDYTRALKVKGLLNRSETVVEFKDRSLKLNDFFVVNERNLYESLTDEEIVDWYYKGWIAWSYAHIHSIGSIIEILKRMKK